MKEIRVHGRGGQGAMAGARLLATAFVYEGKWACSFPDFGFERRGAPVRGFIRINEKPIREKTKVYHPDCLIVIDPLLIHSTGILDGMKAGGILVLNARAPTNEQYSEKNVNTLGAVNATRIGLEEMGMAVTNTCMLGAFARTTDWVKIDSILFALKEYFSGDILKKNIRCVKRGFDEAVVQSF